MSISEFENKWLNKINSELLKTFPDDFILDNEFAELNLPPKSLTKGTEIFGVYEIIDTDGKTFYQSENLNEIKYILYACRNNQKNVKLITNKNLFEKIVQEYEKHIDDLLILIEKDYKKTFPASKDFVNISNRIFKLLNLSRY
ncbi:MAG: hypothetical protein HYS24_08995 [Ignavibacteriales bacterium]|nr:hypothetical protein [Ignavibacteriales bacterium]MBK7980677.1 hypothetical protein [Ignavibacteriota bacterium]